MKTLTKKLVLSLSVMLLALVAVATSTYAWFTVNGTVTTEKFVMQAETGADLKIQLYGVASTASDGTLTLTSVTNGFVGQLSESDFNKAIAISAGEDQGSFQSTNLNLKPLTTVDGKKLYALDNKEKGMNIDPANIASEGGSTAEDIKKYYITFVFEFQSSASGEIYVTENTKFVNGNDVTVDAKNEKNALTSFIPKVGNISYYKNDSITATAGEQSGSTTVGTAMDDAKFGLTSALRVSFSKATLTKADGVTAKDAEEPEGNVTIWEPGKGLGQGSIPTTMSENFAVQYYNARHTGITIENDNYTKWVTALTGEGSKVKTKDTATFANGETSLSAISTADGTSYTAAFVVRIWIEGWDADCVDGIMDLTAALKMQFSSTKKTA